MTDAAMTDAAMTDAAAPRPRWIAPPHPDAPSQHDGNARH
jgi:hypothetical protein